MFRNGTTFVSLCNSSFGDNQRCGAQAAITVVVLRDHMRPSRSGPLPLPSMVVLPALTVVALLPLLLAKQVQGLWEQN